MEHMTQAQLMDKERLNAINSQKAAALFHYNSAYKSYSIPQDWAVPNAVPLLLTDTPLHVESAGDITDFPAFLRTCPLTPRHGVIESIRCDSMEDLHANFERLRDIMLKEDPGGCLMLMPYIDATNSAVMALSHGDFRGYTIFGPGHDGVTAGHGLQLGFPLRMGKSSDNIALQAIGRSPSEHELEFVFKVSDKQRNGRSLLDLAGTNDKWLTQIRGAPEHSVVEAPPEGVDTIGMVPQGEVVVDEFIMMTGLEEVAWLEENVTAEKAATGFVVVEPNGSRLSHIYAHCRGVGAAYIITDSVNKGDRWVEAAPGWVVLDNEGTFEPKPYSPAVYREDFIRGINAANVYWAKQHGWFATFFHQYVSAPMSKPQDVAYLAGVFAGWLPKAIMALGLGEMRHANSLKSNASAVIFATIDACVGSDVWKMVNKTEHLDSSRSHYYAAIGHLTPSFGDMALMMHFLEKHFAKGWVSNYGGPTGWGVSMAKGAVVAEAINAFLTQPTDENFNEVLLKVNEAENVVHNNGFLFNKWLSKRAFDAATAGFNPREDIGSMSATYAMAHEMLNADQVEIGQQASEPVNSWADIFKFVQTKTPAYWRKNPIAVSQKVPEVIRTATMTMPANFRHGDRGSHNTPQNKDFIMCGVQSCSKCAAHIAWAANNPSEVPELQQIQSIFTNETAEVMLTPANLDVWLVGTKTETRASVKQQVALIKAKEFDPTPEEFKTIYNALKPDDAEYPDMMLTLNKWLAKKGDDLQAFMEALTNVGKEVQE